MKKIRLVVIGILCISIIVGYYYFLSTRNKTVEETELTEVQKVILEDLEGNYPLTPREVVKFYNKILCCYYNEEHTEEELYKLADQALLLMDAELAANNPPEQYYIRVKTDVDMYHENKRTINNASVCDTNEVEFATIDGAEYAYVKSSYFMKENGGFVKSNQNYVLREDEEGRWKILAFELVEGDKTNNE